MSLAAVARCFSQDLIHIWDYNGLWRVLMKDSTQIFVKESPTETYIHFCCTQLENTTAEGSKS